MSLEKLSEACSRLNEEIKGPSENLGYNIQVCYSQTDLEKNNLAKIYIFAEYKSLINETRKNKLALRKVIPRSYEHNGLVAEVYIEYVKSPAKIRRQVGEMRKAGVAPAYI